MAIVALIAAAIWKARKDAVSRAKIEASYISAALDDDVAGVLRTLSCASRFLVERVDAGSTPDFLRHLYDQLHPHVPSLSAVSLIGPGGEFLAKSDATDWDIKGVSAFEFFRRQQAGRGEPFQIGKPLSISGRMIVPASRRLQTASGSFGGLVLFSIDPAIGASTYRKVNLGETGSIKVIGTDGTIFAGYALPGGFDAALIGTYFAG